MLCYEYVNWGRYEKEELNKTLRESASNNRATQNRVYFTEEIDNVETFSTLLALTENIAENFNNKYPGILCKNMANGYKLHLIQLSDDIDIVKTVIKFCIKSEEIDGVDNLISILKDINTNPDVNLLLENVLYRKLTPISNEAGDCDSFVLCIVNKKLMLGFRYAMENYEVEKQEQEKEEYLSHFKYLFKRLWG